MSAQKGARAAYCALLNGLLFYGFFYALAWVYLNGGAV